MCDKLNLQSIPPYIAIVVSFASLISTFVFAYFANQYSLRKAVSERMAEYIKEYKEFRTNDDVFSKSYYEYSVTNMDRSDILFGMLVSVIDAMNFAEDSRAHGWSGFLQGMPGPLNRLQNDLWAAHPKTIRQIEAAKIEVKSRQQAATK